MPDKALYIGHSLVGQDLPYMLNSIMNSLDQSLDIEAQMINGAPLRWNWDNGQSAQGVNARAVLPSGDYDAVIITEATLLQDHIRWNDTFGYALRYYNLAIDSNPDTKFFIYETWPSLSNGTLAWRDQIAEDLSNWEGIADHINAARPAGAQEVLIIPAAQALANLRDAIIEGRVPFLNNIFDLFDDDIHLNDLGNWFMAALHSEVVAGVDASTVPRDTYDVWGSPFGVPAPAIADAMRDVIDQTLEVYSRDGVGPNDGSPSQPGPIAAPIEVNGDEGDNNLSGDEATNIVQGFGGNDTLSGGMENDTLDGGEGWDRGVFSGDQSNYTLTLQNHALEIQDRRLDGDGTDTLIEIEELGFGVGAPFDLTTLNGSVRLTASQMEDLVELYIAYFNRAPDAIGLNFWGTAYANGMGLGQIASLFNDQPETTALYPDSMSNAEVVTAVYSNVLGRAPDADGSAFWQQTLDAGSVGRDQFILAILEGAMADPPSGSAPSFIAQQAADRAFLSDKTDIGAYFAVHRGMSDTDNAATVMSIFDGSAASRTTAVNLVATLHSDITGGTTDEFLMPLVGVLDVPDFI